MKSTHKPIVGITIGDVNGIGPEVILKSLQDLRMMNFVTPVIYGSTKVLSFYKKKLGLEDLTYNQVKEEHQFQAKLINVVNCWEETIEIRPGHVTKEGGTYAWNALKRGAEDLKAGFLDAIVTAPINKASIQSDEFGFPGHTEYFASISENEGSLMFMVSDMVKVAVVTGHIPLSEVGALIDEKRVKTSLRVLIESLKKDFGIKKPKIGVLGVNPHAGESGLLGTEEKEILVPTIAEFKEKGDLVFGPFPSDGFFGSDMYQHYDACLAMYHDQGLIPFKCIAFTAGVNFTAGLSFIRTSPDHGTGFDIAGEGVASCDSMRAAIMQAYEIAKNHRAFITV